MATRPNSWSLDKAAQDKAFVTHQVGKIQSEALKKQYELIEKKKTTPMGRDICKIELRLGKLDDRSKT